MSDLVNNPYQDLSLRLAALESLSRHGTNLPPSAAGGLTLLPPAVVFSDQSGPLGWTAFSASGLPSTAKAVLLFATARRDSSVTGFRFLSVRAKGSGSVYRLLGQNSNGVDSDTEGASAQGWCPLAGGAFEYSLDAGMFHASLWVYGFWA